MKKNNVLDSVDTRILHHLQLNCRITNVELSKLVNLSPTPCLERVRRLEKEGYISKQVAILDAKKLGLNNHAFVQITLDRTTNNVFARFKEAVMKIPYIVECHMVAGGYDYLIKVRTKNMDAFRVFLGETLDDIGGIGTTHTYVVMEEVKNTTYLPLDD